ncbi:MAG: replication-relaxation family protein [Chloroflexota bacterium]
MQLSDRDRAVLTSLSELRMLTAKQIQRLHVADGSPLTQARRTRAVLQRLTELRVVVRLARRIGGIRAGSEGHVYGLSGLGQAVLEVDGPYGGRRRPVGDTKPAFQDHLLAVSELYVRLVEISRTSQAEVLLFHAEPACWRVHSGIGGQRVVLKPDAYLCLGIGDFEQRAFIELDQASEHLPTIARKCQRYVAYWHSGLEQQRHGVFPKIWWLVPSPHRRDGIASVIRKFAHSAQALFTVALQHEAPHLLTQPPPAAETEA